MAKPKGSKREVASKGTKVKAPPMPMNAPKGMAAAHSKNC